MHSLQALFGGTFDPIHYGHLKPVEILANQIGLQRVTIMPNNVPPHRPQPEASAAQRKMMLELAIADKPLFQLDERELRREQPVVYRADVAGVARRTGAGDTAGLYHRPGLAAHVPGGGISIKRSSKIAM